MIVNKLVRDNIPDIILSQGGEISAKILDDSEYKKALFNKLSEEISELKENENLEELADIYEVFLSLINFYNYKLENVVFVADKKREENGAFNKRIFLKHCTNK